MGRLGGIVVRRDGQLMWKEQRLGEGPSEDVGVESVVRHRILSLALTASIRGISADLGCQNG